MNDLGKWIYAVACVLIPVCWGLLMVWLLNHFDGMQSRSDENGDTGISKEGRT
ncbi:MAG: hypothetical protein IT209_04970 [Armatimonadetes bacterium]|nr:hypothetical protein [Armatimonadota bacterium]